MKIATLLITSLILLYSCNKNEKVVSDTENATKVKKDSVNKIESITYTTDNDGIANAVASNKPDGKPALNPAHGEPYHRCEIPVGAPIDSAPQQNTAPQMQPQQSATNNNFNTNPISPSVSSSAAPTEISGPKPALNPAHGEPYHRCDLQVGAPLT